MGSLKTIDCVLSHIRNFALFRNQVDYPPLVVVREPLTERRGPDAIRHGVADCVGC